MIDVTETPLQRARRRHGILTMDSDLWYRGDEYRDADHVAFSHHIKFVVNHWALVRQNRA